VTAPETVPFPASQAVDALSNAGDGRDKEARMSGADRRSVLIAVAVATVATACAPVFSDLQSARTLPPGKTEVTPLLTTTGFVDDDESEHVQNQLGLQVALGATDRFEVRGRYERVFVGEEGANVFGLGPKIALVRDRLSLYVPLGLAFGGDIDSGETLTLQPTLIASAPAGDHVEVNLSAKGNLPLKGDEHPYRGFGLNLGLGLGPRGRAWSIRPEAGILFARDDVKYLQASIGISLRPE
jgi:hypothetical protein